MQTAGTGTAVIFKQESMFMTLIMDASSSISNAMYLFCYCMEINFFEKSFKMINFKSYFPNLDFSVDATTNGDTHL